MNIIAPATLAAASLVLGTRSTSEGSGLLFFIHQGRRDSLKNPSKGKSRRGAMERVKCRALTARWEEEGEGPGAAGGLCRGKTPPSRAVAGGERSWHVPVRWRLDGAVVRAASRKQGKPALGKSGLV